MTTDVEQIPAVRQVTSEIADLERFAQTYQVTTGEQYAAGAADLQRVKSAQKRLEETRTAITVPMNAALKRVNDFFRAPTMRLEKIERTIKSQLVEFSYKQERIRLEEQRKADEIARKERERLEAQAREADRKAREKAAADRQAAEAAAAAGRAEEAAKLAARAAATEEKAAAKVDDLAVRAATTVAPVIVRDPPKVAGVSTREVWKFDITDASQIPREYLVVDEARIRKVVQALKGDAKIAGVRVYPERQIAAGSL
jgi:DNA polymerase III alpha subunit (gram-positive type)